MFKEIWIPQYFKTARQMNEWIRLNCGYIKWRELKVAKGKAVEFCTLRKVSQ